MWKETAAARRAGLCGSVGPSAVGRCAGNGGGGEDGGRNWGMGFRSSVPDRISERVRSQLRVASGSGGGALAGRLLFEAALKACTILITSLETSLMAHVRTLRTFSSSIRPLVCSVEKEQILNHDAIYSRVRRRRYGSAISMSPTRILHSWHSHARKGPFHL